MTDEEMENATEELIAVLIQAGAKFCAERGIELHTEEGYAIIQAAYVSTLQSMPSFEVVQQRMAELEALVDSEPELKN